VKPGAPLGLDPRSCDGCGSCVSACTRGALKVGRTYLKVDWQRCDACGACARVCAPRAIVLRKGAAASSRAPHVTRPVARHSTNTPRARSAAKIAEVKASGRAVLQRATSGTPKGGSRGGFQWTLLEAAAMLSVTFSAFMLKEALMLAPVAPPMPAAWESPARVGLLAAYYVVQVAVLVWLVRRRGGDTLGALGLKGTGRGLRGALFSTALVVAGLVSTRLVASLYVYVTRTAGLMPSATTDLPALFGSSTTGFMLAVLMVVVIGPVVEEAVFRGALLEGMTARWGMWPAIIAQALLFAVFHRSLWLLFPTFVLGVALGWLAHTRESLWPSIALHGLYNAITVTAAFLVVAAS